MVGKNRLIIGWVIDYESWSMGVNNCTNYEIEEFIKQKVISWLSLFLFYFLFYFKYDFERKNMIKANFPYDEFQNFCVHSMGKVQT